MLFGSGTITVFVLTTHEHFEHLESRSLRQYYSIVTYYNLRTAAGSHCVEYTRLCRIHDQALFGGKVLYVVRRDFKTACILLESVTCMDS